MYKQTVSFHVRGWVQLVGGPGRERRDCLRSNGRSPVIDSSPAPPITIQFDAIFRRVTDSLILLNTGIR